VFQFCDGTFLVCLRCTPSLRCFNDIDWQDVQVESEFVDVSRRDRIPVSLESVPSDGIPFMFCERRVRHICCLLPELLRLERDCDEFMHKCASYAYAMSGCARR
jgi:hypothetical protein